MMTCGALLAPFVMARFLTGRAGPWLAIGACTNTLFLLVATPAVQFDWLVTQPYGLSISLGFAALIIAADAGRVSMSIIGFVLLALACWVNIGVGLMLAIAAVIIGTRPVRLLILVATATALASLAARYGATAHTVTALAAAWQWLDGWRQLLEGLPGVTASPGECRRHRDRRCRGDRRGCGARIRCRRGAPPPRSARWRSGPGSSSARRCGSG